MIKKLLGMIAAIGFLASNAHAHGNLVSHFATFTKASDPFVVEHQVGAFPVGTDIHFEVQVEGDPAWHIIPTETMVEGNGPDGTFGGKRTYTFAPGAFEIVRGKKFELRVIPNPLILMGWCGDKYHDDFDIDGT